MLIQDPNRANPLAALNELAVNEAALNEAAVPRSAAPGANPLGPNPLGAKAPDTRLDEGFLNQPSIRDRLPDDETLDVDLEFDLDFGQELDAPPGGDVGSDALNVTLLNVPYRAAKAGFDGAVLDAFFRGKRVEAAREFFYVVDGRPHLSCWIEWTPGEAGASSGARPGAPSSKSASGRSGVRKPRGASQRAAPPRGAGTDNDKHGDDDEFAVAMDEAQQRSFDGLRTWRLVRARELGVPAYRVLTNRVMERVARANPTTVERLSALPGVGPSTVTSHGEAIVGVLRSCAVRAQSATRPEQQQETEAPAPSQSG
jgi:hypothetical protein